MSGFGRAVRRSYEGAKEVPETRWRRTTKPHLYKETIVAKFIFLFRSNPTAYQSISPEQGQQIMKKWMDWRSTLDKTGHVSVPGDRLDWSGKVVRGKSK